MCRALRAVAHEQPPTACLRTLHAACAADHIMALVSAWPTRASARRSLGSYRHVGSVLWLDRTGEFMPGNYTAFAQARPGWYTGSTYDHHGYLMAMKQALICNPAF